jgi:Swt1-like HEPN
LLTGGFVFPTWRNPAAVSCRGLVRSVYVPDHGSCGGAVSDGRRQPRRARRARRHAVASPDRRLDGGRLADSASGCRRLRSSLTSAVTRPKTKYSPIHRSLAPSLRNPRDPAKVDDMESSASIAIIETDLRHLVTAVFRQKYGQSWQSQALQEPVRAKLQERHDEERKRHFPAAVPSDLMSYTHLYELRQIIERNWGEFASALGAKKEFMVLMDKVEDFRNAPAHSRELLPHERTLLEGIAGEVRTKVTVHLSQQSADTRYYPVIESVRDSFGNEAHNLDSTQSLVCNTGLRLKVGQDVLFECRGWDPHGRTLTWMWGTNKGVDRNGGEGNEVSFTFTPQPEDVGLNCVIAIDMSSDGQYHRHQIFDQRATFSYDVEPPDEQ